MPGEPRSPQVAGAGHAPLERFQAARIELKQIYAGMKATLQDAAVFFLRRPVWVEYASGGSPTLHEEPLDEEVAMVNDAVRRSSIVIDTVSREAMKAVFFGRTSTGKSTLINAMLQKKILPSGVGHTTNCFCRVVGVDDGAAAFVEAADGSRSDVADLRDIAHALFSEEEDESRTTTIYWPREKCTLLKDYVEIVDTPGLDLSEEYDGWIDEHCKDADILILLVNSESALNRTERRFLEQVHARVANPTVFVCFNRWDCIDDAFDDTPVDGVRAQHLQSAFTLLVDKLEMVDDETTSLDDQVFLLSAKEALMRRTSEGSQSNGRKVDTTSEQSEVRYTEFCRFEERFAQCLSVNAMAHRFETHAVGAKELAGEACAVLAKYMTRLALHRQKLQAALQLQRGELEDLRTGIARVEQSCAAITSAHLADLKHSLTERVRSEAAAAVYDSIRGFRDVEGVFSESNLEPYTAKISEQAIAVVQGKIRDVCATELRESHAAAQHRLVQEIVKLLPSNMTSGRVRFETGYSPHVPMHIDGLVSSFKPDIAFRFSLGLSAASPRISAFINQSAAALLVGRPAVAAAASCTSEASDLFDEFLDFTQTPQGMLVVAGAASLLTQYRTRIVSYGAVLFFALYVYERASYTKSAKIHRFKNQLIEHTKGNLDQLVPHTAFYASEDLGKQLSEQTERTLVAVRQTAESLESGIADCEDRLDEIAGPNGLESGADALRKRFVAHLRTATSFVDGTFTPVSTPTKPRKAP
eukprot:m.51101 g.51101  ORF g.51101 m.51101 type:complete len:756 (+) comp9036_c0_seq2:3112-5379(+)